MSSIINNFLIRNIYSSAFSKSKFEQANAKREQILSYDGVERRSLSLSSGNLIDGFYFDAKKLQNSLEDPCFSNTECFEVTEKLPSIGDETVLLIFGNRALCELKCNHLISLYLNYGFNVRVYNQPGYGMSLPIDGSPAQLKPEALYEAASLVYQDLRKQLGGNHRILVHGISLGSCSAAEIASQFSQENMTCILDRPISRMSLALGEAVNSLYPRIGFLFKDLAESAVKYYQQDFPNNEKIAHFSGDKIALLSAEQDELFSIEQVKGLFKKLPDPKPSFEDVVISMPAGHGGTVKDWSESPDPLCKEKFNKALMKLGYNIG